MVVRLPSIAPAAVSAPLLQRRVLLRLKKQKAMKSAAGGVWVLVLCARAAGAQGVGPGSLGVYADPEGTVSCASVPSSTATVLYVVATTGGLTAAGLAGAEFRVEVTNPTGWYIDHSYAPPSALVIGDLLDTNPDPNAGGGMKVSFASCAPFSPSGKIGFGTISVFNLGTGGSTSLVVRRHSTPANPTYACALFVACDAPAYTKYCAAPLAGAQR